MVIGAYKELSDIARRCVMVLAWLLIRKKEQLPLHTVHRG
jgi:hypothetical protein